MASYIFRCEWENLLGLLSRENIPLEIHEVGLPSQLQFRSPDLNEGYTSTHAFALKLRHMPATRYPELLQLIVNSSQMDGRQNSRKAIEDKYKTRPNTYLVWALSIQNDYYLIGVWYIVYRISEGCAPTVSPWNQSNLNADGIEMEIIAVQFAIRHSKHRSHAI